MRFYYGDINGILYDKVQYIHNLLTTYNCVVEQRFKNESIYFICKINDKIFVKNTYEMLKATLNEEKYNFIEEYINTNVFFNIDELIEIFKDTFKSSNYLKELEIYFSIKFGQNILNYFNNYAHKSITFTIEM